ncbi:DUF3987 domain-containing protein [Syntrophobacter fumaroxidans]|uniref:DUF3987 domain-containing protein n=1 Tax=Syntrophobacter fumaroxidans (strain DSM 10017 / MPOB) TaxID=335543 RepID=A0LL79_SYNFM|nr:DUF3987 domain-containing protein [Syntrophobacter fumaroxidans]ABK18181.1 hypothetical protein Sfum_2502 [Syntrophobacter fumaroxidans MPOB]
MNITDILLAGWPKNLRTDGTFTCPACGKGVLTVGDGAAHCPGENREFTTGDLLTLLQQSRSNGTEPKTPPKQEVPPRQSKTESPGAFPHEVMSGFAGNFASLFSSYTEAPAQFYYFSAMTMLGNVLADKIVVESQIATQPRLYCLLLGESADDRKSTAISQTVKFFLDFFTRKDFGVCHGVGSAEGLQKRLEENNKLLLCFDEFKAFVAKCKIESSVLLPCLTTLFESGCYESRTKTSDISIQNAQISILGASTVPTYETMWSSQFTDIGFINRLWIVTGHGERRFSIPPKIPVTDISNLRYDLQAVLQTVGTGFEMPVDKDAEEIYHTWYMNLDHSVHSRRLDGYALRLMPLLAVNDRKRVIDLETVKKAIRLCDWQLEVRKLHDPIDSDSVLARMEEKIRRTLRARGALTERELKQATHANRDGLWVFAQAKQNLVKACEIAWNRGEKRYETVDA